MWTVLCIVYFSYKKVSGGFLQFCCFLEFPTTTELPGSKDGKSVGTDIEDR